MFLDTVNIYASVRDTYPGMSPDHGKLLREAIADNHLHKAIAYCVRQGEGMDRWKEVVGRYGYEFQEKVPIHFKDGNGKADQDMEIACDVWRLSGAVDMIVLLTGDGDFIELVRRCKELGKITRVMGVPGSTSHTLIETADEFTPITEAYLRGKRSVLGEKLKAVGALAIGKTDGQGKG